MDYRFHWQRHGAGEHSVNTRKGPSKAGGEWRLVLSSPVFCRRFVGRHDELRFLADRRRELGKTHGGIALIGGEAGIGKSRLVREFLAATSNARGRVAIGQCRPFGSRPYGPILELLETLAPQTAIIEPADSRYAQHRALVDALLKCAEKHALICVVEDLHWADDGTLNVLTLLAESLATRRVLVVGTYRTDDLHADPVRYNALGSLMRKESVWPVALIPLGSRDASDLIDGALEGHPIAVSRQTRRDVLRGGEGNPFFTEELLKSAVDNAYERRHDRSFPTTVRAAILQRLEPFEDGDRRILTQAAVIGRRFDGELLAQTMNAQLENLLPALQRARRCQLVEETSAAHIFRFRHALTRDVILDDLLAAQRRPLHARIAAVLEERLDDRDIDALAYHAWASGDREKALRYGERAGDLALRVNEYAGAISAYERTLPLLAEDGSDAARVHEKIGTAYYRSGLMDRASEHYAPAWNFFKSARADAAVLFRLARNAAGALYNDGRPGEALALWTEAVPVVAAAGNQDVTDLARVTHAQYLVDDGDVDSAQAVLAQIDLQRVGEQPELAVTYWGAACVAFALRGDMRQLKEAAGKLCSIPRTRSLLGPINDALGEAGMAALHAGASICARRCLEASLELCRSMRSSEMLLSDTLLNCALERLLAGDYAEARKLHSEALALLAETKVTWYRAWVVGILMGIETNDRSLQSRQPDAASVDAAFATGKAPIFGPLSASLARVLCDRGDSALARALLRRAVDAASCASSSVGTFPLIVVAAELCDRDDASAIDQLGARDAAKGPALQAAADLARAILAVRFAFETASDHGVGLVTRADLATRAAELFAVVGWPRYEEQARALLERFEGSTPPAAPPKQPVLTTREFEIARLVASGLANREVAGSLFVSVKLVEKQLSSIYRKLGIRSRSQLTNRLLRDGSDLHPSG
jgi:DNA-binding CsgD family transcriptional regulator